ncbi:MAG TPA: LytR C-terminal domain-containing protein, partial [Actinomycetota bacterium]|nr:LytR C-terminal domain-containing protein [Actinomycetota bacterium]
MSGRHSSGSQVGFYRSVLGWALPWMVIAAGVAIGVWVAVNALGNGDPVDDGPAAAAAPSPSVAPRPSSPEPSKTATPRPKPSRSPDPTTTPRPKSKLITEGITVQVLNGTGDPDADDRMASRLADLGFEVLAVDGSSKAYAQTTVFWSYAEAQKAGEALARRFGWSVGPKPSNLSTTVALHVVVGDDFR